MTRTLNGFYRFQHLLGSCLPRRRCLSQGAAYIVLQVQGLRRITHALPPSRRTSKTRVVRIAIIPFLVRLRFGSFPSSSSSLFFSGVRFCISLPPFLHGFTLAPRARVENQGVLLSLSLLPLRAPTPYVWSEGLVMALCVNVLKYKTHPWGRYSYRHINI